MSTRLNRRTIQQQKPQALESVNTNNINNFKKNRINKLNNNREKYNPDITEKLNNLSQNRKNTKLQPTKNTYKIITKDRQQDFEKNISNQKDLQISVKDSKNPIEIEKKFVNNLSERKLADEQLKTIYNTNNKNTFENKFNYINTGKIYEVKTGNDLKTDTVEYYRKVQTEFESKKNEIYQMINSLNNFQLEIKK